MTDIHLHFICAHYGLYEQSTAPQDEEVVATSCVFRLRHSYRARSEIQLAAARLMAWGSCSSASSGAAAAEEAEAASTPTMATTSNDAVSTGANGWVGRARLVSEADEVAWIAERICSAVRGSAQLHGLSDDDENESDSGSSSDTGSSWRDWVVLTRHNSTARRIGRKLAEGGVPVHVPGSEQRWVPPV